jgi:crotonobetainyl-CoA:carnitine CoA-transferase CaiB-like acyl-CoA transferase
MDCDVSLFDTAISMLTYPAIWNLNGDFEPQRTQHSAHPSLVPFQALQTSDAWIVVACPKEKFWQRLTVVIEKPELADDTRFATFEDRHRNAPALLAVLEPVFLSRSATAWLEALRLAGVPCAPVNSVAQALRSELTASRGMVVRTDHPRFGSVQQVRGAVRVGTDEPQYRRAPARNEHQDRVLRDLLAYDTHRIAELTAANAFGPVAR